MNAQIQHDNAGSSPYFIPQESRQWQSWLLAALVHITLLAALWFGAQHQDGTVKQVESGASRNPDTLGAAQNVPDAQAQTQTSPSAPAVMPTVAATNTEYQSAHPLLAQKQAIPVSRPFQRQIEKNRLDDRVVQTKRKEQDSPLKAMQQKGSVRQRPLVAVRDIQKPVPSIKKIATATGIEKSRERSPMSRAKQMKQAEAAKKAQQNRIDATQAEQLRLAEMHRIAIGSTASDKRSNPTNARAVRGGSG